MKKSILIFDAGKLICSVMVPIGDSKVGTAEKLHILWQDVEYEIMYVVGMDYGIIIPTLSTIQEITDFTNLH